MTIFVGFVNFIGVVFETDDDDDRLSELLVSNEDVIIVVPNYFKNKNVFLKIKSKLIIVFTIFQIGTLI